MGRTGHLAVCSVSQVTPPVRGQLFLDKCSQHYQSKRMVHYVTLRLVVLV